ncbi:hypothetical protein GHT06_010866 [Daphnia sinensis]|uniref:Uncharacterized protein n=1 Tax=Daphnia sinensis TaxID=1820382 RepID=A0AAD5LSY1_9CRUS|nr:hypothetical protein GHT06_010866 [Daphnia sinensis]
MEYTDRIQITAASSWVYSFGSYKTWPWLISLIKQGKSHPSLIKYFIHSTMKHNMVGDSPAGISRRKQPREMIEA